MEKHNERGREGEGELGESFIRSVWSSSKDVVVEMGDVGLDLVTKSELLESIPVLGVFAKLSKAAYSLRNRLFLKKLQKFFKAVINNTCDEEKEEFRRKMESDPELGRKVGENTILLIERHGALINRVYWGKCLSVG